MKKFLPIMAVFIASPLIADPLDPIVVPSDFDPGKIPQVDDSGSRADAGPAQAAVPALVPAAQAMAYWAPANSPERIRNLRQECQQLLDRMRALHASILVSVVPAGSSPQVHVGTEYQVFYTNTDAADLNGSFVEQNVQDLRGLIKQFLSRQELLRQLTNDIGTNEHIHAQIYGITGPAHYNVHTSDYTARGQNYPRNDNDYRSTSYHVENVKYTEWNYIPKQVGFDSNGNAVMRNTWVKETKTKNVTVADPKPTPR